jgi:tetratricopeptide (TPR) repeat protein
MTGLFAFVERRAGAVALLLGLLVLIPYAQIAGHGFINYDDPEYVVENAYVNSGLRRHAILWAFTAVHSANWHPLTWISHMLDCELFGLDAGGHHLASLLLHAANTVLLFLVLRRATGAVWPSAAAAALFGVHPLHVESVAWVSERKDVLSTCFGLLSLFCYAGFARGGGWRRYGAALFFFACGLASKPMVVTLPCVMLLLDWWPLRRLRRRALIEKIPFFALSAASSAVTLYAQRDAMPPAEMVPIALRLKNAAVAYVAYLGKAFWPQDLAVFYPLPDGIPAASFLAALFLLAALSLATLYLARRRPYLAVGWLWYLGTLVPVIGLVQVGGQAMADRYTYIPLVGIFIAAAWGARDLLRLRPPLRPALAAAALALIGALAFAAHRQAALWQDNLTLFAHAARVTARNHVAYDMLGVAMTAAGRYPEALEWVNASLRIKPRDASILNNAGFLMGRMGDPEAALRLYRQALEVDPRHAEALNNLGVLLARRGQFAEAIELYRRAIQAKPHDIDFHFNLGIALVESGRLAEGIAQYGTVLKMKPDHAEALNNLGVALARLGRYREAASHFSQSLAVKPDHAEARRNLEAARRLLP